MFAAPGAAGVAFEPASLGRALVAFALFCLAASGTYFLNDARDAAADRLHPRKSSRPVAAGALDRGAAAGLGLVLMAVSVSVAALGARPQLALVLAVYLATTIGYSLWLKDQAVLDVAAVASGFVLRAIAGGVAVGVPLSNWFLIVASFGSLFMVAGKRHAELVEMGDERGEHRVTLRTYSVAYLRYVRSVSSGIAITAYCLWAFEKGTAAGASAIWFELSVVPFVLALLRYALLLEEGEGGAPEELVLRDRPLQAMAVAWLLVFTLGVYGG